MRLHRIHALPAATRVQFDHADLHMTWRGNGGTMDEKRQIAERLATCWNVLEGMPTALLLEGVLRELCDAVAGGDLAGAQAALAKMDRGTDTTDGRLHDCKNCITNEETTDG